MRGGRGNRSDGTGYKGTREGEEMGMGDGDQGRRHKSTCEKVLVRRGCEAVGRYVICVSGKEEINVLKSKMMGQ